MEKPPFAHPARISRARIHRIGVRSLLLMLTLVGLIKAPLPARADVVTDVFGGTSDPGWLHYTPLEAFGTEYRFGVTNGVYSLGVGPSSIAPISSSLIAAGRIGVNWQDFDVRIEFSGWEVGVSTNTAISLIARQNGDTNTPPYGPFTGYSLTVQPSTTPELAATSGAQARLVISTLEGSTLTPIATAQLRDLNPTNWYELRFTGSGTLLSGRVSSVTDRETPLAEVRGSDPSYSSGFFSIGVVDQAGQAGVRNNGAHARFRNLRASSNPTAADLQSPPPAATYSLIDRFPKPNDVGWTRFNPFASFGVFNGFSVTTNGLYYLSAAPSPIPKNLPATVASLRREVDWSDFQTTVDFTAWEVSAKTNGYILSIARARTNNDNTLDFYGLRVVPSGNPDLPGTAPFPFLIIDRWDHGIRTRTNSEANLQAITFLDPLQRYRMVFTGQSDLLTGRLYHLADTNTPIAETSLVDSTLRRGFVGLMAVDRFALNNAGNSGVRVAFANFAGTGTPVSLNITREGALQWPAIFTGFTLQQTTRPTNVWTNVAATVRTSGTNFVVSPGTSSAFQFYRLIMP